jgi:DnaK suppressor protein
MARLPSAATDLTISLSGGLVVCSDRAAACEVCTFGVSMASKKTLIKNSKAEKKTQKKPAKKAVVGKAKASGNLKKGKPKSSSRKIVAAQSAKKKSLSKVKAKNSAAVKKHRSVGKGNRTLAMVRRAASAPISGRKKASRTAADVMKKAVSLTSPKKVSAAPDLPAAEPKLTAADLEYFRALLVEKRRELIGDMGSMENTAFNSDGHSASPIHMADVGTDNFEQEFTLGLLESERQTLREIHEAIERIDNGTFGICVATGKPIGRARLEAKPWAKYCIEYARQLEQGRTPRTGETNHQQDDGEDDDD